MRCAICGGSYPRAGCLDVAMRPGRLTYEAVCVGCFPGVEKTFWDYYAQKHLTELGAGAPRVLVTIVERAKKQ